MITYLRMSSAWHKGMARPGSPRSLAGDGEVGAGGQGLPDVPGHPFGPAPPPVDQHHDGGQVRTVTTAHTESAILRGGNVRPHVNQVSAESAIYRRPARSADRAA